MQHPSPIKHVKNTTIVNRVVSHLTLHTLDASHQSVFEDFSNTFQNPALNLGEIFIAWEMLTQALLKKFTILIVFYMNTDHALREIETLCNILQKTHTWPLTALNFSDLAQTLETKLRLPQSHSRVKHYYQTLEKTLHYYTQACDQCLKNQRTTTPYPPNLPISNLNQSNLNPILLLLKEKISQTSTDTTDTTQTLHTAYLEIAIFPAQARLSNPAHPHFFLGSSNDPANPQHLSSPSSPRMDRPAPPLVIRQDITQEVIKPVLDSLYAIATECSVNNLKGILTTFRETFMDTHTGVWSILADRIARTYTSLVVREESEQAIQALESLNQVLTDTNTWPIYIDLTAIEKQVHTFLKNMTSLSRLARLSSIQHGLRALRIIQSTLRCEVPRTSPVLASAQSIDRTISMVKILLKTDFFSPSSDSSNTHIACALSIKNRKAHTFQRWKNHTHRHHIQSLQQRISQLEDHRMHSAPIQTPIQPSPTSLPAKHFHAHATNTPVSACPPHACSTNHPPANQKALIQSVLHNLSPSTTECTVNNNLNDTLPLFVDTFKNFRLSEPSQHAACHAWQQLADTIAIKFQSLVMREKSPRAIHNLKYLCTAFTKHQAWPVYHLDFSAIGHKLHAAFQAPSNTPCLSFTQHSLNCLCIIQMHCLDACHLAILDTPYAIKTSRLTQSIARCLSILEKNQSLHTEAQNNLSRLTAEAQIRPQVTENPSDFASLKCTRMYFFQRWKSHTHRHRVQRLQQRISQLENAYAQANRQNPASPPSLFSNFSSNPDSFFIPHDTTTNQKTPALPRHVRMNHLILSLETLNQSPLLTK